MFMPQKLKLLAGLYIHYVKQYNCISHARALIEPTPVLGFSKLYV